MTASRVSVVAAARVAAAVLRRPSLWPVALRQARILAAPQWWRRAPYLPIPPQDYLHFRLVTAYGGRGELAEAVDPAADLVAYLRWCAQWQRLRDSGEPGGDGHR